MINGTVRLIRRTGPIILWEPHIAVAVAGVGTDFRMVDAVVDTGFTGMLALPNPLVRELGLSHQGQRTVNLAHGSQTVQIYGAVVQWFGRPRAAVVHEIDGAPLVGSALLTGCRLTVDFRDGGSVAITPLHLGQDGAAQPGQ